MKQARELYNLLKSISDSGVDSVAIGIVDSVDKDKCSCVVLVDEQRYEDVRLKSTMDSEKGFKVFPKPGSNVLVQSIGNGLFGVAMMGEVDSVLLETGSNKVEMDSEGIFLGNNSTSLLEVLELIIDATIKVVVIQGQNPDYVKLAEAKTKVNTFLKQ